MSQTTRHRPAALKVVAWVFILSGLSACIEIIVALTHGRFSLNFDVIGIFIGWGILKLSSGWRLLGLISLWIAMIGAPVIIVMAFSNPGKLEFKLFGAKIADMTPAAFFILVGGYFLFKVWQYRVLTRSDVRALFYANPMTVDETRRSGLPRAVLQLNRPNGEKTFRDFLNANPIARHLDATEQMRRFVKWKNQQA